MFVVSSGTAAEGLAPRVRLYNVKKASDV